MALTTSTIGSTVRGVYDNVKDTFPASVESSYKIQDGIATTDTLVAGTGYTTSAVETATTSSGSGTGCTVTYTAAAGGVTVVVIVNPGTGYVIGDTQTIIAGGSDATFDALTLTADTISSVDTLNQHITGVNTTFLADVKRGDFIWFTTIDDLVEVESVVDNLNLYLKRPVASTITAAIYKIVPKNSFKSMSWLIDSANTAEINSVVYPLSTSESIGDNKPNGQGGGRKLSPILVDTLTNANIVYVTGE